MDALREAILELEGVTGVHDLHVWTITSGLDALSAHVHHDEQLPHAELLSAIRELLHSRFHLDHLTIQLEPEGFEERGAC